jgi:DmsE family decaheme c-type cytochrome
MKTNSVLDRSPVAVLIAIATAFVLGWLAVPSAAEQADEKKDPTLSETKQYIGDKACTICHAAKEITVIEQTPHGNASNPHSPAAQKGCESCHGPASLHVSRSGGQARKENIVGFGSGGSPAAKQLEACLSCHANAMGEHEGMQWQGSVHGKLGFSCSTCHQVHVVGDPMKKRDVQAEKCFTCHAKQKTEHPRFEAQGIVFDELSCWSCHDVHQLIPQEKSAALGHGALVALPR